MEGFLDLNSSPKHPRDHLEESFKRQVHGVYAVPKSLMKGDSKYTRFGSVPMKRTFTGNHSVGSTRFLINNLFSQENDDGLKLSLSIGRSANKRRKSWKNKIVYPSSLEIIDLEEDSGIGSSEDVQPVFCLDHLTQKSTDRIKQYPSHGKIESMVNGVEIYKGYHEVKQRKVMDFDLNKDQPDEDESSSFHSNEPSSDLTEENEINIPKSTQEKKKEDSDYAIQKAANSLISISLQPTPTNNHDSQSKSASNETENKIENEKTTPRRSSSIDSYESLVLKLEESIVDEDCVTSHAFEIRETGLQIENGINLRRGRRLKDFQKDILPTLSSLSRHEIWEDIKILEGVIRSREYKRLQKSKITPMKNKRSKVNYVGQKCYLRKKR